MFNVQLLHGQEQVAVQYFMTVNELAELTSIGCVVRWLYVPQSTMAYLSWGFHTVWGGIDPWDHRFRPRFVGVVEVWTFVTRG